MKEDDGNYLQPGVDLEDSHRPNSERSHRVSFTQTLCIGICLAAVFVTSVAVLTSMLSEKAVCPQVRAGCVLTCPDEDQRDIGLPLEGPTTVRSVSGSSRFFTHCRIKSLTIWEPTSSVSRALFIHRSSSPHCALSLCACRVLQRGPSSQQLRLNRRTHRVRHRNQP